MRQACFDVVLPRKDGRVASHGIAQHALVGIDFRGFWMVVRQHFRGFTSHFFAGRHDRHAHGDIDIRADAEAQMILRQLAFANHRGRQLELGEDFSAGDRKALARP